MTLVAELEPNVLAFYTHALGRLQQSRIPFLVGGAFALGHHTGIARDTRDLDIFVKPEDCQRVLALFAGAGYQTELTFPHWLGKVFSSGCYIDIIFSSGNGIAVVDEEWFEHAARGTILEFELRLCPAEETIWSKAFIMERERFDGADIAHLIRARGMDLDWPRLIRRFGSHWRVLLSHLILFGFTYPSERSLVPHWVHQDLLRRLQDELAAHPPTERLCQGPLLSRAQYLIDIEHWGYVDARLQPRGALTPEDAMQWTAAIETSAETAPAPPSPSIQAETKARRSEENSTSDDERSWRRRDGQGSRTEEVKSTEERTEQAERGMEQEQEGSRREAQAKKRSRSRQQPGRRGQKRGQPHGNKRGRQ